MEDNPFILYFKQLNEDTRTKCILHNLFENLRFFQKISDEESYELSANNMLLICQKFLWAKFNIWNEFKIDLFTHTSK